MRKILLLALCLTALPAFGKDLVFKSNFGTPEALHIYYGDRDTRQEPNTVTEKLPFKIIKQDYKVTFNITFTALDPKSGFLNVGLYNGLNVYFDVRTAPTPSIKFNDKSTLLLNQTVGLVINQPYRVELKSQTENGKNFATIKIYQSLPSGDKVVFESGKIATKSAWEALESSKDSLVAYSSLYQPGEPFTKIEVAKSRLNFYSPVKSGEKLNVISGYVSSLSVMTSGTLVKNIAKIFPVTLSDASIGNSIFKVEKSKTLNVYYHNAKLLGDDKLEEFCDMNKAETLRADTFENGKGAAINLIGEEKGLKFRREIALRSDGRLELTIKADYGPAHNRARGYDFYMPLELFDGGTFKAWNQVAVGSNAEATGKISASMPDGKIFNFSKGGCRYITFSKGSNSLTFDFNSYGLLHAPYQASFSTSMPWAGEPVCTVNNITKEKDRIHFKAFPYPAFDGLANTLVAMKVVITQEKYNSLEEHPLNYSYYAAPNVPPPSNIFAFGSTQAFTIEKVDGSLVGNELYAEKSDYGWKKTSAALVVNKQESANYLANSVRSSNGTPNSFIFNVPDSAFYAVIINVGDSKEAVEAMSIKANGKMIVENLAVPANGFKQIIFTTYINSNNPFEIEFSGSKNWAVHNIITQKIFSEFEYAMYQKPLWFVPGLYEPTFGLPDMGNIESHPSPKLGEDNIITTPWFHGHYGSGFEYNTPALVEQRVLEIKNQGYSTIEFSPAFHSVTLVDCWDELTNMLKLITATAHKNGLKVMYHSSTPITNSARSGRAYLEKHYNWLMRDIRNYLPYPAIMCINNAEYRAELFARLSKLAKESDCDYYMLDECYYRADSLCGCEYCRAAFTLDTGAILPLNPNSEVFFNLNSPLWIKWLNWRQKSVGKWWVDVRKIIKSAKPDADLFTYQAFHTYANSGYANRQAIGTQDYLRGSGHIGGEVLIANAFILYRAYNALQNLLMAFCNDYNAEGFHWYTGNNYNDTLGFTSWALGQMNKQSPVVSTKTDALKKSFKWNERMPRDMTIKTDVAIFYNLSRRDIVNYDNFEDKMGYFEMLSDAHIQADFVTAATLTPEGLKKHNTLLLASVANLSKEQAETIRQFVKKGGTLIVSAFAGSENELAEKQDNFQLADVMGVDDLKELVAGNQKLVFASGNTNPVIFDGNIQKVKVRAGAQLIAESNGAPAIVINNFGQGKCIYIAIQLGLANCEKCLKLPSKMEKFNQAAYNEFITLVNQAIGDKKFIRSFNLPERKVLTKSFVSQDDKTTMIHLFNVSGVPILPVGTTITTPLPKSNDFPFDNSCFPALTSDIVLEVKNSKIKSGYIISPDFEGRHPVSIIRLDNGYVKITVNRADLDKYSLLCLTE